VKLQIDLNDKLALSVPEAGAMTGTGNDFMYKEINLGRLKTAKIGGRRLIRRQALERWLEERERATDEAMAFHGEVAP
jgi:excisionase family DNA binding protein